MICHKVYRFRMRPTAAQEAALRRQAGARRWAWNWALARWKDFYAATGRSIGRAQLSAELTALKRRPETAWLREVSAQALQQALRDLDRAFAGFFARRSRYPRFRSRKRDPLRFRAPQDVKVRDGRVLVPRIGWVRMFQSQAVGLPTKGATFKCDAAGRWFVTLVAAFELPDAPLPPPDPAKVIGIDLGLKDFAVLSDGRRVPAPRFYRAGQRKLRRAQRALSRREAGSRRREKARRRVARIHRQIADRRGDFLHKLSTDLVRGHEGLCIEDLSLNGLVRTKLARSFTDAALGEFRRLLVYKCQWHRTHLAVVDRWYPSSRLCRGCGAVNAGLTLSDRRWTCGCGMVHDRDLSAAINIRDEGLRLLAVGHTES